MRFPIALVAGLLVNAAAEEATAATFTPDMWVYQVTLTLTEINGLTSVGAFTKLPSGSTALPGGRCEVFVQPSSAPQLYCEYDTFEEALSEGSIDVFAQLPKIFSTRTVTIAFNKTTVLVDGYNRSLEIDLKSYAEGELELEIYDSVLNFDYFQLSPLKSTGYTQRVVGPLQGEWDVGIGGRWSTFEYDIGIIEEVTDFRLVSTPAIIPLPAPVLMLGSGLAALAVVGARRRARGPAS
jgi:hypothetical protein